MPVELQTRVGPLLRKIIGANQNHFVIKFYCDSALIQVVRRERVLFTASHCACDVGPCAGDDVAWQVCVWQKDGVLFNVMPALVCRHLSVHQGAVAGL